jgi:signal transduction histidine kinase
MFPERLDRVFDRFWQPEQFRSHESGVSSLGLTIAQSQGGLITVIGQVGLEVV